MQNNVIFYFTGTGNCLKVSKDLGKALENCEVISMPAFCGNSINKNYERIGFIFPVYSFDMPNAVKKFINETNLPKNNTYYFTIITHGGVDGNAIPALNTLLKEKGITLNACFNIKMAASYICFCDMPENSEKIHKQSQVKINLITESVKNKLENKIKTFNLLFFFSKYVGKYLKNMDKYYTVSENCTGCGICRGVCPVKNIEMENNRPVFKHDCEQCTSCIQCCPSKALNYRNKTQNRRRYINPEISITDIINGNTYDN